MRYIICTKKDTGKRLLVDSKREPNYKDEYNDEHGQTFCSEVEVPDIEPAAVEASESFICEECDKEYATQRNLDRHNNSKH